MSITNILTWFCEHIPALLLEEPFSGLFGLILVTYIIDWIFGFSRRR